MEEKPLGSTSKVATINPVAISIGQELSRSFAAGIGAQVATSVGESLRSMAAPTISEALEGFQAAQVIDTKALGVALSGMTGMQQPPAFNFVKSLDAPVITPKIAAGIRVSFANTFRVIDVPSVLSRGVNEALMDLARMPKLELGSQFEIAAREAAVIAESPAMREQMDGALDLEDLTPAQRRAFQITVIHAIAGTLTVVAYLADDGRVELTSACLALAAILISLYWQAIGKLD